MVRRRQKNIQPEILQSIISLKERQGSLQKAIAGHLESKGISISKPELAGLLIKMTKKGTLNYDRKTKRYKINPERFSARPSARSSTADSGLATYEIPDSAARGTRRSRNEQERLLKLQVSHDSRAVKYEYSDHLFENKDDLMTLIYLEFRNTLFKQGDTIKLFNQDRRHWNTCTLASNDSFINNKILKGNCPGGPKYIISVYNTDNSPLNVAPPPLPDGKFINLLNNLCPFESCYSSNYGKITFAGVPERFDFFTYRANLNDSYNQHQIEKFRQQGLNLINRWKQWCDKSSQGNGSVFTNQNLEDVLGENPWEKIMNWGLQLVMHSDQASIPTDDTPSGRSMLFNYDVNGNLSAKMTGGENHITPRAPLIIWLYNNGDIGQELFANIEGRGIFDMTGNQINPNQIDSKSSEYFTNTGIEAQIYRHLYLMTLNKEGCGGAALTAIHGLQVSSLIGEDGSLSDTNANLQQYIDGPSSSVYDHQTKQLDSALNWDDNVDGSAYNELMRQQSIIPFSSFNLPNAKFTISPGIWIIVDVPRMPHSILVILKGGKRFTIGAGYDTGPTSSNPFSQASRVPLKIYSPDTSLYSAEEEGKRDQQVDFRLSFDSTKHQHIRDVGPYNPQIMQNLNQIIQNSTSETKGGQPEFVTTFNINPDWALYQTLPLTPGSLNCTSLALWIVGKPTYSGVCAPGGVPSQIMSSSGPSGHLATGPLGNFLARRGGRRKRTKRRRKHKTKRMRHGKKRVKKTRGKKKRRGNRKRRTRR